MAGALGTGNAVGEAGVRALDLGGYAARLLPAVVVSALAVPAILALRAGRPTRSRPLGLGAPSTVAAGLARGILVTGWCAALVLAGGTAAGWVTWSGLEPAALASFLMGNALVAVLLEALPEELTLRGQAWASLRERFGGAVSALGTTTVFLLVPAASTMVQAGVAHTLGVSAPPVGLAPGGQDPLAYLVLLTVFGLTLVAARTAPGRAPLGAAIGAHLALLSVNRVVFEGDQRSAGWSASVAPDHAAALELACLLATAAAFLGTRLLTFRRGVRARRPVDARGWGTRQDRRPARSPRAEAARVSTANQIARPGGGR
ncbi:type II CAAX prenyl endopeptidase Rce1 family protein [Streptomyces sp. NPDC059008]|uniref:CPBP family glutamic-type intramembrane protease n=1 Tax=Streptomyces sp. NPDC059008 TaxID=3346693 RepID=UPI0036BA4E86